MTQPRYDGGLPPGPSVWPNGARWVVPGAEANSGLPEAGAVDGIVTGRSAGRAMAPADAVPTAAPSAYPVPSSILLADDLPDGLVLSLIHI